MVVLPRMNNTQQKAWNDEYIKPQLLTKSFEPQAEVLRFLKWLKKDAEFEITPQTTFLDLGCGTGRNTLYVADQYHAKAIGYDFSEKAIQLGQEQVKKEKLENLVEFEVRSIGDVFPLADNSVDIVFDVTSSNSLSADERNVYLQEVFRVLKSGGYFFTRALSRDGDRNAQNLINMFPGEEYDTYIHPDLHVTERVFREKDFRELYGLYFEILFLKKETGYQRWVNQSFKRRYLVTYMRKSE